VKIHQFTPILEPGAVGSHTLMARDILREAGHTSEIFTPTVHPACADAGARPLGDYRRGADVLVYHLAIGSPVANMLLGRREPLVVDHHNLTPLRYLESWQSDAARGVVWGRAQLRELAARATLGIGDSHFNEAELIEAGYPRTTVVPILFDPRSIAVEPDPAVERHDATTWLFVGRLAANKAQHDIVKAFAAYRQFHDERARLHLVGGGADDPYGRTLLRFIEALGLHDAVTLTGGVSAAQLAAYYATADVFVVCSEHEGFCVPLLEAMHHGVPIVAFAAAAVPETLGDAGLLLDVKDACTVAAAVDRVIRDSALRDQLVDAGRARLEQFDVARTGPQFLQAVTSAAQR
jgi:glycosyltransferase involved in cell wall biosynthesis